MLDQPRLDDIIGGSLNCLVLPKNNLLAPERLQYSNKQILVVDDNHNTAHLLQGHLVHSYGNVEALTDPTMVLDYLMAFAQAGRPYSLLVLDLHMPGMSGMQVLKALAALDTQELPAIVINTAELMANNIADIAVGLDALQGQVLEKLPLIFHWKVDPFDKLVSKIDAALKLATPAGRAALTGFVKTFQPRDRQLPVSHEIMHLILEDLRNFALEMEPILQSLSEDPVAQSWWSKYGHSLQTTQKRLARLPATDLNLETPALAESAAHVLLNMLFQMQPQNLSEISHDNPNRRNLVLWRSIYGNTEERVRLHYHAIKSYARGDLNIGKLVKDLVPAAEVFHANIQANPSGAEPVLTGVQDPGHNIKNLIIKMIGAYRLVAEQVQSDASTKTGIHVQAVFCQEEDQRSRSYTDPQIMLFDQQQIGDFWKVVLVHPGAIDLDSCFAELVADLAKFQANRHGFLYADKLTVETRITLVVKVTAKKIDYRSTVLEKAVAADGSWILRESRADEQCYRVQEGLGNDRNLITIGLPPNKATQDSSPVLYQDGGRVFWCDAKEAHYLNCRVLDSAVVEIARREASQLPDSINRNNADAIREISNKAVRVILRDNYFLLDLPYDTLMPHWAIDVLEQLGVPKNRIMARPEAFNAKSF